MHNNDDLTPEQQELIETLKRAGETRSTGGSPWQKQDRLTRAMKRIDSVMRRHAHGIEFVVGLVILVLFLLVIQYLRS